MIMCRVPAATDFLAGCGPAHFVVEDDMCPFSGQPQVLGDLATAPSRHLRISAGYGEVREAGAYGLRFRGLA